MITEAKQFVYSVLGSIRLPQGKDLFKANYLIVESSFLVKKEAFRYLRFSQVYLQLHFLVQLEQWLQPGEQKGRTKRLFHSFGQILLLWLFKIASLSHLKFFSGHQVLIYFTRTQFARLIKVWSFQVPLLKFLVFAVPIHQFIFTAFAFAFSNLKSSLNFDHFSLSLFTVDFQGQLSPFLCSEFKP